MLTAPIVIGLNHLSAPLIIREKMSLSVDKIKEALSSLPLSDGIQVSEAVILSTCNRTELYCFADPKISDDLFLWFSKIGNIDPEFFRNHFYFYFGSDAVNHIFKVASGLDSMVLGEPEILGQVKRSVVLAKEVGTMGVFFHRLFQDAFSVAKTVRTETNIGKNSVSIAAACVRLAEAEIVNLHSSKILFIGAGEMIELCIKHFISVNSTGLVVANRTLQNSKKLAEKFSIDFMSFDDIYGELSIFDIIISCTASQDYIINSDSIKILFDDKNRLMIDLAVPRDIDPGVSDLDNIHLYSIDDLSELVQQGVSSRLASVPKAERIIMKKVEKFMSWVDQRDSSLLISKIVDKIDSIKLMELNRAEKILIKEKCKGDVLVSMAHRLTRKFAHGIIYALKNSKKDDLKYIYDYLSRIINSYR